MNENGHRVLVVDDEPCITELLSRWLEETGGYRCDVAHGAEEALELLPSRQHDLLISDVMMPGMSGLELLELAKSRRPDLAVLMATGVDDRRTAVRALQLGAYGYLLKPFGEAEVIINVANALERRRLHLLDTEYKLRLEKEVREKNSEVGRVREEACLMLVTASEFRDRETGAHVRRMGLYSEALAIGLGWGRAAADDMRLAAPMHDVGKIGVPDDILLKPGRLTEGEFEVVKRHAAIGARILSGSNVSLLQLAQQIARSHHERWDGSGYPEGRAGEAIPAPARLVAIVDVYDALVHDRVYRAALPEDEALRIMTKGRGSHFDPQMFDIFFERLPEMRRIRRSVDMPEREAPPRTERGASAWQLGCDPQHHHSVTPHGGRGGAGDRTDVVAPPEIAHCCRQLGGVADLRPSDGDGRFGVAAVEQCGGAAARYLLG